MDYRANFEKWLNDRRLCQEGIAELKAVDDDVKAVEYRFGGSKVFMRPASKGTGLTCGGAMRAVLETAGVRDILAKSRGSSNPHNLVKATIMGLCELRDAYTIAQQRGISMDKVFNG